MTLALKSLALTPPFYIVSKYKLHLARSSCEERLKSRYSHNSTIQNITRDCFQFLSILTPPLLRIEPSLKHSFNPEHQNVLILNIKNFK